MRHPIPWLAAGLIALMAAPASAGIIRGEVRLPPAGAAPVALQPYAGNANSLPGARAPVPGRVRDAIVYVERLSPDVSAAIPAPALRPQLIQEEQSFKPRVLAVARGTEVDFPNRDAIYHNVFSLSPIQRFDLGKYPRGQSRQVTFRRAGVVHVFCDIHSNMEAFIRVLPNRAFAQPDDSGAFALPDLPGGTYELVLWHPEFGETRAAVSVPDSRDARVTLRF
jgi:plastocyanin